MGRARKGRDADAEHYGNREKCHRPYQVRAASLWRLRDGYGLMRVDSHSVLRSYLAFQQRASAPVPHLIKEKQLTDGGLLNLCC